MLQEELTTLKTLYQENLNRGNNKASIVAPSYLKKAEHIKTIIDLLESSKDNMFECKTCEIVRIGTSTKQFCSNKCRQKSFKQQNN